MGTCFVCDGGTRDLPAFFISQNAEWNIVDISPKPRHSSLKVGAEGEEIKSSSKQETSRPDGTFIAKNVKTHSSDTNSEKLPSLISKDYQASTKNIKTSTEPVVQTAWSNSIIEKSETASGPSTDEESVTVTPYSATEGEKNTCFIQEDKPQSLETHTPNSLCKPESTLDQQSLIEGSSLSVVDSRLVQERETPITNELYNNGRDAHSTKNSMKNHSVNKRCMGVEDKLRKKTSTRTESSISPISMRCKAWDSSRESWTIETKSGITIPIPSTNSVETDNETNGQWSFTRKTTPITIKPNEDFKSELTKMQEKDALIKELQLQNARLLETVLERRKRGKISAVLRRRSSCSTAPGDEGSPALVDRMSGSTHTGELLHEKVRNIRNSLNNPQESPLSQRNSISERLARNYTGELHPLSPFRFRSAEEAREQRSNFDGQGKEQEYFSDKWVVTEPFVIP